LLALVQVKTWSKPSVLLVALVGVGKPLSVKLAPLFVETEYPSNAVPPVAGGIVSRRLPVSLKPMTTFFPHQAVELSFSVNPASLVFERSSGPEITPFVRAESTCI
jgi:hypothetical protein